MIVWDCDSEMLNNEGRQFLVSFDNKQPTNHIQNYIERDDTEASLWNLVSKDQLGWDEYERRIKGVLERDERLLEQAEILMAERPKVSKPRWPATLMTICTFLGLCGVVFCAVAGITSAMLIFLFAEIASASVFLCRDDTVPLPKSKVIHGDYNYDFSKPMESNHVTLVGPNEVVIPGEQARRIKSLAEYRH